MSSLPLNQPQPAWPPGAGGQASPAGLSPLFPLLPPSPSPGAHGGLGLRPPEVFRGSGESTGETLMGRLPFPHPLQGATGLTSLSPKQLPVDTPQFLIPALSLGVQRGLCWPGWRGGQTDMEDKANSLLGSTHITQEGVRTPAPLWAASICHPSVADSM